MHVLALAALLVFSALFPLPTTAELVVMEDGRFLKASGFEVQGQRVRVELLAGGALTIPLKRVARIIDDEVMPRVPGEVDEIAPVTVAWEFDAGAPVPAIPYGEEIFKVAERHGVNADLVAALVSAESAYKPGAVSHKGAGGLMQLMPATAARFGLTDAERFVPERNLEAGTRYLRWLLDRFEGDVPRALAAYNAGEGTVDRYDGIPPYRETREYIRRIYTRLGFAELAEAALKGEDTVAAGA